MLLFFYYVPKSHLEQVNQALFDLGLGAYQNYDSCCWYTLGQGQFRPLENSQPFIGKQDQIEVVEEYKVELICTEELKNTAIMVLKQCHPYETPTFGFVALS